MTEIDLGLYSAWNVADGHWGRVGFDEAGGRDFLQQLFASAPDGEVGAIVDSRIRLQQGLMAARGNTFERIQQESPFSRHACHNMERLVKAWAANGEAGYRRVWEELFRPGWEARREPQDAVQVVGGPGDCQERALRVVGAPDAKTRGAAEWWYLYYTFKLNWSPGFHATVSRKEEGVHFSMHGIDTPAGRSEIYFLLPW